MKVKVIALHMSNSAPRDYNLPGSHPSWNFRQKELTDEVPPWRRDIEHSCQCGKTAEMRGSSLVRIPGAEPTPCSCLKSHQKRLLVVTVEYKNQTTKTTYHAKIQLYSSYFQNRRNVLVVKACIETWNRHLSLLHVLCPHLMHHFNALTATSLNFPLSVNLSIRYFPWYYNIELLLIYNYFPPLSDN